MIAMTILAERLAVMLDEQRRVQSLVADRAEEARLVVWSCIGSDGLESIYGWESTLQLTRHRHLAAASRLID